jgi:outer membrane receptor protein involved in Fe transport
MRLTDASGLGGVNLGLLGLTGVDRVEIQKGPSSTRFGSDALGGVVALYSPGSAPLGVSGDIAQKVGTHGNSALQVGTAYGWNAGWLRASVEAQQADYVMQADHPYRAVNTFMGFGQQVGNDTLLTLNYLNSYAGVPIPIVYLGSVGVPRPNSTYNEKREDQNRTQVVSGSLRTAFSSTARGEITLGQVTEVRLEPQGDGTPGPRYVSR